MALRLGDQKNKRYVKITPTPVNRHGSRVVGVMGCGLDLCYLARYSFFNYALAFCVLNQFPTPPPNPIKMATILIVVTSFLGLVSNT